MRARALSLVVGVLCATLLQGVAPAEAAGQWGITMARVDKAWTATRPAAGVTVAVVDTGVSPLPDLAGRLLPGYDFVNGDSNAADDNGHGTMAATVVAANRVNRIGVAGVCGTCRILPVKVLGKDGSGGYDRIATGIRYAADHGAKVVSVSLGGADDSTLLRDAVAYATGKGSLVVAAAGNRGSSKPHYPAAIPAALAVGGVTATGARYPWSNYGSDWVDLVAPGCNPAQAPSGAVSDYCGTSSATPFVAGVAGLLASSTPAVSVASLRAALVRGALRGRVDAVGALTALGHRVDVTPPAVQIFKSGAYVTARATDASGIARLELVVSGRAQIRHVGYLKQFRLPATGVVQVRAVDRAGNARLVRVRCRAADKLAG